MATRGWGKPTMNLCKLYGEPSITNVIRTQRNTARAGPQITRTEDKKTSVDACHDRDET